MGHQLRPRQLGLNLSREVLECDHTLGHLILADDDHVGDALVQGVLELGLEVGVLLVLEKFC